MARLYGDATPFPHDVDYLEIVRSAVQCAVRLLQAQAIVDESCTAIVATERALASERARLDRIGEAVRRTLLSFDQNEREVRIAGRIRDVTRATIDEEASALVAAAAADQAQRRAAIEAARLSVHRALEELLRVHVIPGTQTDVSLRAEEHGHVGEVTVHTPFGVRAVFRLDIGQDAWQRHRRVSEIAAGCDLHVPHEAGWISKRIELQRVKLDKLFVTEAVMQGQSARIELRKAFRGGHGYALHWNGGGGSVHVLEETGKVKDVHALEIEDFPMVLRLRAALATELDRLAQRRAALVTADFDGVPLGDLNDVRMCASRLIATLAPLTNEIERRSGGNDELVMRRDVGDGKREEKYVKKGELRDLVYVLPTGLRSAFEPLQLVPRSSLTPAPPVAAYADDELSLDLGDDPFSASDSNSISGVNEDSITEHTLPVVPRPPR